MRLNAIELHNAWKASKSRFKARETFTRRMIAHLMLEKGFPRRDIALMLDVHPNHVPRMAKALKEDAWHGGIGVSEIS
jgi:transposase